MAMELKSQIIFFGFVLCQRAFDHDGLDDYHHDDHDKFDPEQRTVVYAGADDLDDECDENFNDDSHRWIEM